METDGGAKFVVACRHEEERVAETRQKKREAEEEDKAIFAPGAIAGRLRRFRHSLGWTIQLTPEMAPALLRYSTMKYCRGTLLLFAYLKGCCVVTYILCSNCYVLFLFLILALLLQK